MSTQTLPSQPSTFEDKLKAAKSYPLRANTIEIFQMNVGYKCNLACKHCHLEAGPNRTELMSKAVFEASLEIIRKSPTINTVDLTGGAPEMNENLEWFIPAAAKLNKRLIVRSNLVILHDEPYRHYVDLFAANRVEVVGSLPDYHADKSNRQRGQGSFEKVITVLKQLNAQGYGKKDSGLFLDLVHNPVGAYLPAVQSALEHEYRTHLEQEHGIVFTNLFSITNMPLGRYLDFLKRTDNLEEYLSDLVKNYNPANIRSVMCKNTLSVAWDGTLYDCDFNQSLGLAVSDPEVRNVIDYDHDRLSRREIVVGEHCYGCTAGSGSSCQGCFD